jgi:hypothetical protein
MGIKNHTPGQIRYFTYYLNFPNELAKVIGAPQWVDQVPFVHELQFELKKTTFGKIPGMARDILNKGECHWKDQNGVEHRVVVEDQPREKNWGVKKQVIQ